MPTKAFLARAFADRYARRESSMARGWIVAVVSVSLLWSCGYGTEREGPLREPGSSDFPGKPSVKEPGGPDPDGTMDAGKLPAGPGTGGEPSKGEPSGGAPSEGEPPAAAAGAGGSAAQNEEEPPTPPENASCELEPAPCGGDVVGQWHVLGCSLAWSGEVNLRGFGLGCASAPITSGSVEVGGTFDTDADGNVVDETTLVGEQVFQVSAECLSVGIASCERLEGPFSSALGYQTVDCVDDAGGTGGCSCTGTIDQKGGLGAVSWQPVASGNYAVDGTTLTTFDGGNRTSSEYCVEDEVMVWHPLASSLVGTLDGAIVLFRE